MTTTGGHVAARPDRPTRRRRWPIVAAVAAAVVLLAAALTSLAVLRHLDHQYGPLQPGEFGGPYSDRGFVFSTDGSTYHLAPAPGASARIIAALDNDGAHSVTITSIDTGDMVSNIRWSVYRLADGGSIEGVPTPWRNFPAIIPAHGTIRLLITIHHPSNCAAYPTYHGVSDARYDGAHLVHWKSLLHNHTTPIEFLTGPYGDGIRVC